MVFQTFKETTVNMFLPMTLLALTSFVVCGVLKILLQFYGRYRLVEKIPGPPIESRFLGHSSVVFVKLEDIPKMVYQQYKTYGGIFRHWYAWMSAITIAEATYAEIYFTMKSLKTKGINYQIFHDWLGHGLITSSGPLWQERRKLITPAFHFSVLNTLCETLVQNSIVLIQKLREHPPGAPVNIYTMMHLVALDNICESAMGIKIDALNNPRFDYIRANENVAHTTAERLGQPWLYNNLFYCTPMGRKLARSLKKIFEFANAAICNSRRRRTLRKQNPDNTKTAEVKGQKRLAFLDLLMEARDSNKTTLSDEGLRDEVNTFIFAGFDTVATSMSFTVFLLGNHPEIQEKCYQELNKIFQGSDRKPTMNDLRRMKYLEQVIKESLRLFPSVPLISRQVQEDTKFGQYTVPEGSIVALSIYCLHRDPKYFPNPDVFDPDRFSPENCANRHPFAYVPFAAGSRNCIGQKFAMMEEKATISDILRNFVVESTYGMDELQISFDLVLRSQKPLYVKLKPRNVLKR